MMRSTSTRVSRSSVALATMGAVLCFAGRGLTPAYAAGLCDQPGRGPRLFVPMHAQVNNRNPAGRPVPNGSRPGTGSGHNGEMGNPARPNTQQHLNEWMNAHRNLSPAQQQSALEAEPGFRQLRPEEQQRMHNLVNRLNSMTPEQRQRTIARTEWMEHLEPQQRQQVRSAMSQLGSLPPDRSYAVGRAFRSLQAMSPEARQAYLNSSQFRGQFSDQERGTLTHLLNVSPLLPPANLGVTR